MQSLEFVKAYTHKRNGTRVVVDPSAILTSEAASGVAAAYTRDLRAKTVIFPDLAICWVMAGWCHMTLQPYSNINLAIAKITSRC
jgi:Domain of Unknown Function with PDB structure (DUF3857)